MVLLKKEKTRHSLTGYDVKAGIQTTPLRLYSFLRWSYFINLFGAIFFQVMMLTTEDKTLGGFMSQGIIFSLFVTAFVWWGLAELIKVFHTAAYSIDRIRIKLESD